VRLLDFPIPLMSALSDPPLVSIPLQQFAVDRVRMHLVVLWSQGRLPSLLYSAALAIGVITGVAAPTNSVIVLPGSG